MLLFLMPKTARASINVASVVVGEVGTSWSPDAS